MTKIIVIGVLVFCATLVVFAPAQLLRSALEQNTPATLLDPRGTLWAGQGRLMVLQQSLGTVSWDLELVTIVQGIVRYHLYFEGTDHELSGQVDVDLSSMDAQLTGTVESGAVNRWLKLYNIQLGGMFSLAQTRLRVESGIPVAAGGRVDWSGGTVDYQLAGEYSSGNLPEMGAELGPGPEAVVYPAGGRTPLLQLEIQPDGFAKVGITKLLTKMMDKPWPGAHADHAIVLEVEEQVF